jgi:2-hydroxycyclohexanecarboxyl-CoA dehydrogenase
MATAVVTGSGSGIGKAVAARLSKDGFDLALFEVNRDAGEAVAAELRRGGHKAAAYAVDVTDSDAIRQARQRVLADLGAPKVVVNCAGWSVIQPFLENDAAFWKKAIEINLMGTIHVTRAFLEDMQAAGSGRVVNVASDAGRVGSTGEVVNSAAKGGVIAFTKSLAREMARSKISVNCVCPGPTATPMLMVQDPKRIDALTKAIPMRRLAQPEDIAGAVSFFAGADSAYITGQVLSVSGGLTMAG